MKPVPSQGVRTPCPFSPGGPAWGPQSPSDRLTAGLLLSLTTLAEAPHGQGRSAVLGGAWQMSPRGRGGPPATLWPSGRDGLDAGPAPGGPHHCPAPSSLLQPRPHLCWTESLCPRPPHLQCSPAAEEASTAPPHGLQRQRGPAGALTLDFLGNRENVFVALSPPLCGHVMGPPGNQPQRPSGLTSS